jgi:hypothetical protein
MNTPLTNTATHQQGHDFPRLFVSEHHQIGSTRYVCFAADEEGLEAMERDYGLSSLVDYYDSVDQFLADLVEAAWRGIDQAMVGTAAGTRLVSIDGLLEGWVPAGSPLYTFQHAVCRVRNKQGVQEAADKLWHILIMLWRAIPKDLYGRGEIRDLVQECGGLAKLLAGEDSVLSAANAPGSSVRDQEGGK